MARTVNAAAYAAAVRRYMEAHPKCDAPSAEWKAKLAADLGVSEKTITRAVDLCREYHQGKTLLSARGGRKREADRKAPVLEGITGAVVNEAFKEIDAEVRLRRNRR